MIKPVFSRLVIVLGAAIASVPGFCIAASLSLSPSQSSVKVGGTFDVNLLLDTQGAPVESVDVYYLNFNPAVLAVVDADPSEEGVQIAAGNLFSDTLENSADNVNGHLAFSQITTAVEGYSGQGTLATITFQALTKGTAGVSFNINEANGGSNVLSGGAGVLNSVINGQYEIVEPIVLDNPSQPQPSPDNNQNLNAPPGEPGAGECLVKNNGVYFMISGDKRWGITLPGILYSYGFDFSDAIESRNGDMAMVNGGNLSPEDGSLVKKTGDPTV